jgi:hypothetical protein
MIISGQNYLPFPSLREKYHRLVQGKVEGITPGFLTKNQKSIYMT